MSDQHKSQQDSYVVHQLRSITPLLASLGFVLNEEQPHLLGERYLMQAVTTVSGRKMILVGRRMSDNRRVVIKMTDDPAGERELEHERECRRVLHEINFAYNVFLSPEEILFAKHDRFTISVQAFIEQESTFLERPLKEQFNFALKAFKAQESAHATTYKHIALIERTFDTRDADGYLHTFSQFGEYHAAAQLLVDGRETIEQYCNFLTHTDFVPHNFRIKDGSMYLLDHSSLVFGNKYEGWARFLNFMTLYNPALEQSLVQYVRDNRTEEESRALTLMRVYRLGEIIWYYTNTLSRSSGDLLALNEARVKFWNDVLDATVRGHPLPDAVREEYKRTRDALRSPEEKQRQVGLH